MARFIWFGVHESADIVVNTDHIIAVEQIEDGERSTCRLHLTRTLWDEQDYIDVVGDLFSTHAIINDEPTS